MHKLIDYICDELEQLERKADKDGKLSMSEVQYGDTLAHFKKNLLKAEEMSDNGYSGNYSMRDYSMRGDDMPYRGENSYARGRRGSVRRDSMGRYSNAGDFMEDLQELMRSAPNDRVRQKLQSIVSEM